jgi:hypothetical protein
MSTMIACDPGYHVEASRLEESHCVIDPPCNKGEHLYVSPEDYHNGTWHCVHNTPMGHGAPFFGLTVFLAFAGAQLVRWIRPRLPQRLPWENKP